LIDCFIDIDAAYLTCSTILARYLIAVFYPELTVGACEHWRTGACVTALACISASATV